MSVVVNSTPASLALASTNATEPAAVIDSTAVIMATTAEMTALAASTRGRDLDARKVQTIVP